MYKSPADPVQIRRSLRACLLFRRVGDLEELNALGRCLLGLGRKGSVLAYVVSDCAAGCSCQSENFDDRLVSTKAQISLGRVIPMLGRIELDKVT